MPDEKTDKLSTPVIIVAILILIGFVVMLLRMYSLITGASELQWGRAVFLYGGIEALAFAAAGYLFGKEVHREQAAKAEKRADEKTAEATAKTQLAADAHAKGESLAKSISAKAQTKGSPTSGYGSLGKNDAQTVESLATSDLQELDAFARQLFPH